MHTAKSDSKVFYCCSRYNRHRAQQESQHEKEQAPRLRREPVPPNLALASTLTFKNLDGCDQNTCTMKHFR